MIKLITQLVHSFQKAKRRFSTFLECDSIFASSSIYNNFVFVFSLILLLLCVSTSKINFSLFINFAGFIFLIFVSKLFIDLDLFANNLDKTFHEFDAEMNDVCKMFDGKFEVSYEEDNNILLNLSRTFVNHHLVFPLFRSNKFVLLYYQLL